VFLTRTGSDSPRSTPLWLNRSSRTGTSTARRFASTARFAWHLADGTTRHLATTHARTTLGDKDEHNAHAVIVDAIRTPVGKGKAGGALSGYHPVDLLAYTMAKLVERTGIDPGLIDDVIAGCVQQVGEQAGNIAHNASLAAGFPTSVPGTSINRQCGSSQQAAHFAAQGVMAGAYNVVIAAGVESMSRVPLGSSRPPTLGDRIGARFPEGLANQGVSAELVATKWKLDRDALDAFSAESHRRAAASIAADEFDAEIVPVPVNGGTHSVDETVREGTTVEKLGQLRSAFKTDELVERFPDLDWNVTAGNASPFTDGASDVMIMSEELASSLGLRPRARFHAFSVVGDDPLYMLTGPIPGSHKALECEVVD
jgi:acetyl-CoA acyltransferase